jgi:hypothetical protein
MNLQIAVLEPAAAAAGELLVELASADGSEPWISRSIDSLSVIGEKSSAQKVDRGFIRLWQAKLLKKLREGRHIQCGWRRRHLTARGLTSIWMK